MCLSELSRLKDINLSGIVLPELKESMNGARGLMERFLRSLKETLPSLETLSANGNIISDDSQEIEESWKNSRREGWAYGDGRFVIVYQVRARLLSDGGGVAISLASY